MAQRRFLTFGFCKNRVRLARPKNIPKPKSVPFETAIIERYRRRESPVEEALIEMYLADVSVRRVFEIA